MDEKRKVMIVDDDSLILRSVKHILEDTYTVFLAISGEQAYSFLEKREPDVLLLDYEMPGWDGRKTFEMIRQHELGKELPVVFMTGMADADKLEMIKALNPQGIVGKPINEDRLKETLRDIL